MTGVVRHWTGCFGKVAAAKRLFFVHRSELSDGLKLTVGTWVTFEPIDDDVRGPRARAVQLIQPTPGPEPSGVTGR